MVTEAEVELADALGGHLAFTQPDPEGAFAFSGLTPGEYAVIATLAGFAPARATATVGAGETVDLGFLLLAPDIQVAVVRGEALLVGAPVDGHAGTLVDVPATPFSVSTAANGSFRLELSPGNWQLLLSHAGYASVLLALGPLVAGEERDLGTIFLPPLQR